MHNLPHWVVVKIKCVSIHEVFKTAYGMGEVYTNVSSYWTAVFLLLSHTLYP